MPELKPCPFCGESDLRINKSGLCDIVRCHNENCGAAGPLGISEADAIEHWNERD